MSISAIVRDAVRELTPNLGTNTENAMVKALTDAIKDKGLGCVSITTFPEPIAIQRPTTDADDPETFARDDENELVLDEDGNPVIVIPNVTARVIFIHTNKQEFAEGYSFYVTWSKNDEQTTQEDAHAA